MKKSIKISIVIPSYNKVRFIGETLESIIAQNYSNLEVVVQDGRSTDGTFEIVKKYAAKYPKIFKYETRKDSGQLEAINRGFRKSTGEILTFINADDVYEPGALNRVAELYIEYPSAVWFAGYGRVINTRGREIAKLATLYKNLLISLNSRFCLLVTNYLMQPSVYLTREAYETYGPFVGTSDFVLEYDLWLKISRFQMPLVIQKTLSSFRLEAGSKTGKMPKKLLREDWKIAKKNTSNALILFLHAFNNLLRVIVGKVLL